MAFNDEEKLDTQNTEQTNDNQEEISSQATEETEVIIEEGEKEVEQEEIVVETNHKSSKKHKNKKPSKIKGAFSELKKVTWPSFGSVVKKTAVVLSVTLVFLLVIIGIDQLLYLLVGLLSKNV